MHLYDEMFGTHKSYTAAWQAGVYKLAPMSDETRADMIQKKPDAAHRSHLADIFCAFTSALGEHMPTLADVQKRTSRPALRCDYDYNGGTWSGHLEQGFALRRRGGIHFITMRLANDGFVYRDAIEDEIKLHLQTPHHNSVGWMALKTDGLPELQPVSDFAHKWLGCPKEDVRIVVRYNSSAQRVDLTISNIKTKVEFEVLYEPGYPVQDIEDLWEPLS